MKNSSRFLLYFSPAQKKKHMIKGSCFQLLLSVLLSGALHSQIFVSGNISGTWTAGTYIATNHCTVPSGQVLTVMPGVTLIMNAGLTFNVNGRLVAIGNSSSPINFVSPNDTVFWNQIYVQYSRTDPSIFRYCNIRNAEIGIRLRIAGQLRDTMATEISNSTFYNCRQAAIRGECQGISSYGPGYCYPNSPHLNFVIKNSTFENLNDGIQLHASGHRQNCGGGPPPAIVYSYGHISPLIAGNVFKNIAGSALNLAIGDYPGGSLPRFFNNTVVNCQRGVYTRSPYDVLVKNSVFYRTNVAVQRVDTLLTNNINFNCFFEDSANFVNYPSYYGQINWQNYNGDPSDILYNIYVNPRFVDSLADFRLSSFSRCIDAGDSSSAFFDGCRPPSLGTQVNDIGAYGGPGSCAWLVTDVNEIHTPIPLAHSLTQNYPNPFNPETKINFQIPNTSDVTLKIYDLLGREVATLVNERMNPGTYSATWNATGFASGVYLYRMQAGSFVETRKLVLLR